MPITYFLFFLSLSTFAQTGPRIKVIPNPQSIEDFDHQFKGCPENSECDQVMGHMLTRWKNLISKLREGNLTNEKKAQALELYRKKYGIPAEFYTFQISQQGFKPVLYNSSCKDHNPKSGERTLKGIAFLKSLSAQKAIIWRDQSLLEVPLKNNIIPQPVKVYFENSETTYQLPLEDQPLFIKNKNLYVLKEEDGFYYMLEISLNGDWKIVNVDFTKLSYWEEKRQNVACPADKEKAHGTFKSEFCKTVWDEDAKKLLTVRMQQGCII